MTLLNFFSIEWLTLAVDGSGLTIIDSFLSWGKSVLHRFVAQWTSTNGRLNLLQLALSVALVALLYVWNVARKSGFRLSAFLQFLIPKAIYTHPSARTDVVIYLFLFIFKPARFFIPAISVLLTSSALLAYLTSQFGPASVRLEHEYMSAAILGGIVLLAMDFSTYVAHRLQHEVKFLWAFHRVHHSAEVLTPITVARVHPAAAVLGTMLDAAIVGTAAGIASYFLAPDIGPLAASATSYGFKILNAMGANLRHSHVWWSFGPVVGRIFVSPAMHQIHHSREIRHWDKNYGEFFAFWDVCFRSAYIPREKEEFVLGLNGEHGQPHPNLWKALVEPFQFIVRTYLSRESASTKSP